MRTILILFLCLSTLSCGSQEEPSQNSNGFFSNSESRFFRMGFTSWPYAPTLEAVNQTYAFIDQNSDIYSEHIDSSIPWKAWIDGSPLPEAFVENVNNRVDRRLVDKKLNLSVSLLNLGRSDLASDFDGTSPSLRSVNLEIYAEAYFKHLVYLTERLDPDYLIIAIEVNELLKNAPENWPTYKRLMEIVRPRIEAEFPNLPISESITLHNFYEPSVPDSDLFISEISSFANELDFVSISFYPFFKGAVSTEDFQKAFDFLHSKINRPIAFVETGTISEDLISPEFGISISASEQLQNEYLEELFVQAQKMNYLYLIWWTHRDYDELLAIFPEEEKALGSLWQSSGIINEDGKKKEAKNTWSLVFDKQLD